MEGLSNTKRALMSEAVVTFSPGNGLVLASLSFPVEGADHTIQDLPLQWEGVLLSKSNTQIGKALMHFRLWRARYEQERSFVYTRGPDLLHI